MEPPSAAVSHEEQLSGAKGGKPLSLTISGGPHPLVAMAQLMWSLPGSGACPTRPAPTRGPFSSPGSWRSRHPALLFFSSLFMAHSQEEGCSEGSFPALPGGLHLGSAGAFLHSDLSADLIP